MVSYGIIYIANLFLMIICSFIFECEHLCRLFILWVTIDELIFNNVCFSFILQPSVQPTKYHYYPHNQHPYFLPECAIQQVSLILKDQGQDNKRRLFINV